uniref:Protein YIPF n=2 Tax=Amphimedon queenslandica TaxID=400682 RepID=A0A1X7SZD1_AMPQE
LLQNQAKVPVLHRIAAGIVPYPFNLASVVSSNPDLYGPFWICMTLVLTTALSGNISKFFSGSVKWDFHFHEVIVLLTCIYVYTICLPLGLWGLMVWRKVDGRYSLFQLLTVYGYSMSAFIPLTLIISLVD